MDSPLGNLPDGWEACTVAQAIQGRPKNGYSPQAVDEWTGTVMLGLGCLTDDGFAPEQLKNAPMGDPAIRTALLRDGDLLLSRSNTRERVALVGRYRDVGVPCVYPDLMMRLVPNETVLPEFLELALRSPRVRRQLTNSAIGTSGSMLKVNAGSVLRTWIPRPPIGEQYRIVSTMQGLDDRIASEGTYRDKLKVQKRGLMHDLLTGRVRV